MLEINKTNYYYENFTKTRQDKPRLKRLGFMLVLMLLIWPFTFAQQVIHECGTEHAFGDSKALDCLPNSDIWLNKYRLQPSYIPNSSNPWVGIKTIPNFMRHFAYGYNPIPIEITSNQTWDFTFKSYNDIVVKPGNTLTITCRLEMVKEANQIRLSLYPNPVVNELYVFNPTHAHSYKGELISLNGQVVKSNIFLSPQSTTIIPLSELKSGIYILKCSDEKGNVQTHKIIKS